MSGPTDVRRVSPEEYLARERRSEYKSEYYAGEVVAMTGASREHNLIVGNLITALTVKLRGRPCEVYPSDMRVKVSRSGLYVYPDVVVVCGEPRFEDAEVDTLLNPVLLVEVLSGSMEADDRGRKWEHYRRLSSLAEYLLVAQDRPHVEHYRRQDGGLWLFTETSGLEGVLELPAVGCTLEASEIYERVLPRADAARP